MTGLTALIEWRAGMGGGGAVARALAAPDVVQVRRALHRVDVRPRLALLSRTPVTRLRPMLCTTHHPPPSVYRTTY